MSTYLSAVKEIDGQRVFQDGLADQISSGKCLEMLVCLLIFGFRAHTDRDSWPRLS
jgi:hypothetical protein